MSTSPDKRDVTPPITMNIRESYDLIAGQYARHLFAELKNKPLDRELLDRFAAMTKDRGQVCDVGCGPGQIARYLHDVGVSVFGLDLSGEMLSHARSLSPDVDFRQGNMCEFDLLDNSLFGITAFYAIVNLPDSVVSSAICEMHRVLQPGGYLLLAFHTGQETLHVDEMWGITVSMDFHLLDPARICNLLIESGFSIEEVIQREPYPEVEHQTRRAYIFAQKLV